MARTTARCYDAFSMKTAKRFDTLPGMTLKRTTIFLPASMLDRLRAVSRKTGAPVSELIRRGAKMFLDKQEPKKKPK
jgi:hypothetical protein